MAASAPRRARREPQLFGGLLPIDRARVPTDAIAGATLAALAIPEVMGYTAIAGTPVITGLYTLLLPVLAFAVFGSSRHLVVGADSATAAILATGLVAAGAVSGTPEYLQLASLAALLCGALLLVARLLRLGFIANFLSRSVLVGFLTGVGIQVAVGQVSGMTGVPKQAGGAIESLVRTVVAIPQQGNGATIAVAVIVVAVIVGFERFDKRIPGALIAVVGSIVVAWAADLGERGVALLGPVPGGLPAVGLPTEVMSAANVALLMPTVASMVVVILAQSAATSRAYALRYGDSFDENVDLVGLGLANAAAGITGTFVVNGSPTKTEMVDGAGGRSQVSQLTAALITVVVLLVLTAPLAWLPEAALSAIVFLIGLRLVNLRGLLAIARLRPGEFVVAVITTVVVVVVGVEQGILIAMALSILEHIEHSYHPYDTLLAPDEGGRVRFSALDTRAQARPGLAIYRFGSGIYYANGGRLTEEILDLVDGADPPLRWLCLSAASVGDIDYSGADMLSRLKGELDRQGVTFVLSDLAPVARRELDAYGLTAVIGEERLFGSVADVVAAYEALAAELPTRAP
jgi:SulP family sulfate permease